MVRHSHKTSESWTKLPWKKFRKDLFRLQARLFKAVKAGDKRKAKSLQKLILKSEAARFLAIRQVTQLNAGKKTAGVDGKKSLNYEERFALGEMLAKHVYKWQHSKLREIPIPKKDGTTRILKVPTMADRAWQCLAKYALEPAHEATFHAKSYGFRTGRGAHDAQRIIFNSLNSSCNGKEKRVLELDIEKCFDRISHKAIMDRLIAPKGLKLGIFRCLKAGTNPEFPEQGTPQGGVVSPLLANIALNGIESIHRYHASAKKRITPYTAQRDIVEASVRYADDMVFLLRPQDDANEVLENVSQFLAERGMNVSERKTKLTAATDGFDFLGWNFKVQQNGKLRVIPSVKNFKAFQEKVKKVVNCSNYGSDIKAENLAPIVRGWRNYHRYCKMQGTHSLTHLRLRTFKVFNREKRNTKHSSSELLRKAFPSVPYAESKFVCVKGDKSPFDGDIPYWSERNSKLYDNTTAKALNRQKHSCGICGMKMTPGEKVHLHHADGNHQNWAIKNCTAVHQSCHQYHHMKAGRNPRISGAGCTEMGTSGSKGEVQ